MMPARETERMMKLQDVILKAMAKKLTWIQAAEIAGMSVRNMQRMRQRYQEGGYTGLFDHRKGLFCALYSDRGSHFFSTHKAGEPVDKNRPTQFGRALKELGIQMIPAYSPQARGRIERSFGTWQGRLPQDLRLASITTLEQANQFLRQRYVAELNP